jgi:hypothetical protein
MLQVGHHDVLAFHLDGALRLEAAQVAGNQLADGADL